MARESKGQQVKTFKHFVPQPDGTHETIVGKVYLDAKSGNFRVYWPDHIKDVIDALTPGGRYKSFESGECWTWHGCCAGKTMDGTIKAYEAILRKYAEWTKEQIKVKLISIDYKSNLRWINGHSTEVRRQLHGGHGGGGQQISFCGSPTVHINYEVVYEAGGTLYQREERKRARYDSDDNRITDDPEVVVSYRYRSRLDKPWREYPHLIEWTQEREDFLKDMVDGLEGLIMRLDHFMLDAAGTIEQAKRLGGSNPFLLVAPEPVPDPERDIQIIERVNDGIYEPITTDIGALRAEAIDSTARVIPPPARVRRRPT